MTGTGSELEATASTEELGSVEEVSAELEAGVDEAEGTIDVGLVTVEAAFAAVLWNQCQIPLKKNHPAHEATYLEMVSATFCVLLALCRPILWPIFTSCGSTFCL